MSSSVTLSAWSGGVCASCLAALPQAFSLPMETWVAMHEDLRGSLRCRATFDALAEGLRDDVASQPLT